MHAEFILGAQNVLLLVGTYIQTQRERKGQQEREWKKERKREQASEREREREREKDEEGRLFVWYSTVTFLTLKNFEILLILQAGGDLPFLFSSFFLIFSLLLSAALGRVLLSHSRRNSIVSCVNAGKDFKALGPFFQLRTQSPRCCFWGQERRDLPRVLRCFSSYRKWSAYPGFLDASHFCVCVCVCVKCLAEEFLRFRSTAWGCAIISAF